MHILIADDDGTSRALARHLAVRAGHTVAEAEDGAAALQAIAAGDFDAALIDLYMPRLDGVALARAVCALPPERRPRLIALTAAVPPGGEEALRAIGFDAYLSKPLRLAALAAALVGGAPSP